MYTFFSTLQRVGALEFSKVKDTKIIKFTRASEDINYNLDFLNGLKKPPTRSNELIVILIRL